MARPKSFNTDDALLRAMELFWRQGFHNTGMSELVAAMGISRQSLYDTYGDKTQLFLAALDQYCAALEAQLLAPLKAPDAGLAALHDTAMGVIDFLVQYPERRACLMANTTLELAPHDAVVAERVRAHLANMAAAFRHALNNARVRGEIATDADPAALADYLVGMVHGLMVLAKSGASRETLHGILHTAATVLKPAALQPGA